MLLIQLLAKNSGWGVFIGFSKCLQIAQINHPNSLLLNLKSTIIIKVIFNKIFVLKFIKIKIKNKLFIFSSALSLQQTTTTYYLLSKKNGWKYPHCWHNLHIHFKYHIYIYFNLGCPNQRFVDTYTSTNLILNLWIYY